MSGLATEKTAEQIAAEMAARETQSGSPVAQTLAKAGDLAGIGYESGGESDDGSPVTVFGAKPKEQHGGDEDEEGRNKEGGVLHWLGLAGGRKRRRKKSRKKKRKSKRNKRMARKSRRRSRKRRGGVVCKGFNGTETGPECPCPNPEGKRPSVPMMAIGKAAKAKKATAKAARLKWDQQNAKYKECMGQQHNAVYWKKWQLTNEGKLTDWDKQRKEYYVSIKGTGVTGAQDSANQRAKAAREEQERRDKQGMIGTTVQAGIDAYDGPPAAPAGGRRRKSRRKKRRKSKRKKSRRKRKKSRRRKRRRYPQK